MNDEKKLSSSHEFFCLEYIIDHNATRAYKAIKPNVSDKVAGASGPRLLKNVRIASRIRELELPAAAKLGITHESILRDLQKVKDMAMVAEPVKVFDYQKKEMVETGEYVFDSHGANRSLELMGKHLAMFTDKIDHSTKGKEIKQNIYNCISEDQKKHLEHLHNTADEI